jgi:hypothetical protein
VLDCTPVTLGELNSGLLHDEPQARTLVKRGGARACLVPASWCLSKWTYRAAIWLSYRSRWLRKNLVAFVQTSPLHLAIMREVLLFDVGSCA